MKSKNKKQQTSIDNLMYAKQTVLRSSLNLILNHPVTKGDNCEGAWIDFFRSFLPNKYAIDKGFVFDSKGNISEQIDIIIYDSLYTPLIFGTTSGEKYVTAESVYAVFDSKSKITKATLEYTDKKVASVQQLQRTSRGVIVAGEKKEPRGLTPILGGILAADAISSSKVRKYCNTLKHINLGCAANKYSFYCADQQPSSRSFKCTKNADEALLAFFFIILDELYKIGTIGGVDIRQYANATLKTLKFNKKEE